MWVWVGELGREVGGVERTSLQGSSKSMGGE